MASKAVRALLAGARRQSTASLPLTPARCPFARPPTPSVEGAAGAPPRPSVEGPAGALPRPSVEGAAGPAPDSGLSTAAPVLAYSDMPSPEGLPLIGTLWDVVKTGATSNLHLYCIRRHRELGPIYRETLGVVEAVFVADPELIRTVYLNDGLYPRHLVPEPWLIFNEKTSIQRGLFFMDGPEWGARRKSMNQVFLQNTNKENSEAFSGIIGDVMERWKTVKNADGELPDLEKELYKWSIESLGAMIFGRRLGCLENDGPELIHNFVDSVQNIFNESAKMTIIPPKLAQKLNLPVWKRFAKAVSTSLDSSEKFVTDAINESYRRQKAGQPLNGIMGQLLVKDKISEIEFVRIANDLIIAAAHTTSPAAQWTLYLLAKNGAWQQKVLEEIQQVVPTGEPVGPQHLNALPLVRAVVKESLRMYPVAPFLTRILTDDLVLANYRIPAGKLILMSMFTLSRDPKHFPDPEEFNPARWMRKPGPVRQIIGTHACLPFGLGARSCIGRQVAEEQMHLMMARVVQQFKLELANEKDIEVKLRMITVPSEHIRLKLTERKAV